MEGGRSVSLFGILFRFAGELLLCLSHPFPPLREALFHLLGAGWLFYPDGSVFMPPHFAKQNFLIRQRWRLFLTGCPCPQALSWLRHRPD